MTSRMQRLWSPGDEARLLLCAATMPQPSANYARATGRSPASVRTKLCRLLKKPENRMPTFGAERDAEPPRVSAARGQTDTSDTD